MIANVISERGMATRSTIVKILQRVEKLVDQETMALKSRAPIDYREFNNGKSQALLELNLAIRSLGAATLDAELIERLKGLRGKLENNRVVLRMHLEAVREIANVVSETIKDSDWDGTYSQYGGSASLAR
jgi:hypothetical protein